MQTVRQRFASTGLLRLANSTSHKRCLLPLQYSANRGVSRSLSDGNAASAVAALPVIDLDVQPNGSTWLALPSVLTNSNNNSTTTPAAISLASVTSPSASAMLLRFLVTSDATVQELKDDVATYKYVPASATDSSDQHAGDTPTNVTLTHAVSGVEYPTSTTLGCLLDQGDFILSLDGEQVQVRVPTTAPTTANTASDDVVALGSLTELSKMLRMRQLIDADPRPCMPVTEFITLAQKHLEVSHDEARTWVQRLGDAGVVHCPVVSAAAGGEGDSGTVFLHPHDLVNEVRQHMLLDAPHYNALHDERNRCQQRAAECALELSPLSSQKALLDSRAETRATIATWFGVTGLMAGAGTYYWLTYDELSWDLMEPVTYFTFNFFSVVAYFWWWRTNTNYCYSSMHMSVFENAKSSMYRKANDFDAVKYEALINENVDIKRRIRDVDRQLALSDSALGSSPK